MQKNKLQNLFSILAHFGVLLIIAGAFVSHFKEVKFSFILPTDEKYIVKELTQDNGRSVNFGFGISLKSFEVSRYKPDFEIGKEGVNGEFNSLKKVRISPGGFLDFGRYGKFLVKDFTYEKRNNLLNQYKPARCAVTLVSQAGERILLIEGSKLTERYAMKDGNVLRLLKPQDRQYTAVLHFIPGDDPRGFLERSMSMNKPIRFAGWRFYLTSYDPEFFGYIVVTARIDPGRKIVIAGMIVLLIGVITAFYFR